MDDQPVLGGHGNNSDGPAGSLAGLSEPIDERCLASVLGDSGNDLGGTGSGYWHHHVSGVLALGGLRFHCRGESVYPSWVLPGFSNSAHANRE